MGASHYPSRAEQQEYWNWRWRERDPINEWTCKRGETILTLLGSLSLDHPKILDLGCGTGWFTEKLSQIGEASGIDLSGEAIAKAKSQFPHIMFSTGDLFELALAAERFDVVVSQEVIAHVGDQVGYLDRAADVLGPSGYLILTTANKLVMERNDWPPQPPGHIEQWLNMRGLKRLLRRRFRVIHTMSIIPVGNRGILRLVNSYKLNATLRLLMPADALESLKERAGLGYTLIAVAQKKA